jgi:hypothetical protein
MEGMKGGERGEGHLSLLLARGGSPKIWNDKMRHINFLAVGDTLP